MREDLRELYQSVILDHARAPRNFGRPARMTCEAHGDNPMCGDQMSVYLDISDEGIIEGAAFEGRGCALALASASLLTEVVKGLTPADAERLSADFQTLCTSDALDDGSAVEGDRDALDRLRVFSGVRAFRVRVKCATLAWQTMVAALHGNAEATSE